MRIASEPRDRPGAAYQLLARMRLAQVSTTLARCAQILYHNPEPHTDRHVYTQVPSTLTIACKKHKSNILLWQTRASQLAEIR